MFKTVNGGKLPTKGSKYSAGVDVYANEDCTISAGETVIVGLGIAIDVNLNNNLFMYENIESFKRRHYISLKPRSSLRAKGLMSHSAVIDLDYKDEIKMIIHNPITDENFNDVVGEFGSARDTFVESEYKIKKGDRIGQLLLIEHKGYLFGIESDEERNGGFGSTGA